MTRVKWVHSRETTQAFNSSVTSFSVWLVNRYACGHPRSSRFARERVRYEFGSPWPDVMVSVTWLWAHCTHVVVNGGRAPGGWNSLSTCFYGLVSSVQKEKLFTPIIFFMSNSVQAYMTPSLYLAYLLFITIVYYLSKVTLLVLKLLSEAHIFSVVLVINCSWRKEYLFIFENRVMHTRR